MIYLLHYTYGTYILATTLQYIMCFLYFVLCAFPRVHRGDPIKRTVVVMIVSGFLFVQGLIAIFNANWYA